MALAISYEMKPAAGKESDLERVWVTNILRVCPARHVFLRSENRPHTYLQVSFWNSKQHQDEFAKSVRLMEQIGPLLAESPKMTWSEVFFAAEGRQ